MKKYSSNEMLQNDVEGNLFWLEDTDEYFLKEAADDEIPAECVEMKVIKIKELRTGINSFEKFREVIGELTQREFNDRYGWVFNYDNEVNNLINNLVKNGFDAGLRELLLDDGDLFYNEERDMFVIIEEK